MFPGRIQFLTSDISDLKNAVLAAYSNSKCKQSLFATLKEIWKEKDFGSIHLALSDGSNHSFFRSDKEKTVNYEKIKLESPSQFYDGLFGAVFRLMMPANQLDTCLSLFVLHCLQSTHPSNKLVQIKINIYHMKRFTDLQDEVVNARRSGKAVEGLSSVDQSTFLKILNTMLTRSRFSLIVSDCRVPNSITLNSEMGIGMIANQPNREAQVQTLRVFSKEQAQIVLDQITSKRYEAAI